MKIGFIGLGIMGSRMAANLLANNYELHVYNRTREKAEPLLQKGAVWEDTPAEVGRHAEVLFTMLSTPQAVHHVAEGEHGFLRTLGEEKLWVDCSTVNPSFSQVMGQLAERHKIRFVDAPVAGTKEPAAKGELLFLVGGKKEDVAACEPFFSIMGKAYKHIGETGKGTAMKMVVNLLLAEAMFAFSEALTLGESLGIQQEVLLDNLIGGPVTAPFLAGKKEKLANGDYDTEFPLQWMQKDLQLATDTAYETGVSLPAAGVVRELFALAKRKGYAEKDFSAIYDFLKNFGS